MKVIGYWVMAINYGYSSGFELWLLSYGYSTGSKIWLFNYGYWVKAIQLDLNYGYSSGSELWLLKISKNILIRCYWFLYYLLVICKQPKK
jgi:hypothetical protein